jgi:hypothetical protein
VFSVSYEMRLKKKMSVEYRTFKREPILNLPVLFILTMVHRKSVTKKRRILQCRGVQLDDRREQHFRRRLRQDPCINKRKYFFRARYLLISAQ